MFVPKENRFVLNPVTVDEIRGMTPEFGYGKLGEFVFYRTYSRTIWKEDINGNIEYDEKGNPVAKGQERWWQVIRRVIEGVISIRKNHYVQNRIHWDEEHWQKYAHDMAISAFKMHWMAPGRGLWAMGTEFVYERGSMALFNCSFIEIKDNIGKTAAWAMDALMHGVGVGYRPYRNDDLVAYKPLDTQAKPYVIPDTREGWCESVKRLIDSYLKPEQPTKTFDYSKIRPAGKPIRGFGGIASGPEPLAKLHDRIRSYFNSYIEWSKEKKKDRPYDSIRLKSDIFNAVGCCVVAGNVRRSALLSMAPVSDPTFADLKDYTKYPERADIGWMSNNSVILETTEDFAKLSEIAERVIKNGEPGYFNAVNAKYGRLRVGKMDDVKEDKATGLNPCGEILCENAEFCNISETLPTRCDTIEDWFKACEYATFYCSTVNLLPTHSPDTNKIIAKNRRIGVSIVDITGWKHKHPINQITRWMRDGYTLIRKVNAELAAEAGIPESIRVTTVKPGGCRPWNGLVTTTEGILTLEEMFWDHKDGEEWGIYKGGDAIQDSEYTGEFQKPNRTSRISKTYNNGLSPILRIKTAYNFEVECTPNHMWFVEKTHGLVSKPVNGKLTKYDNLNAWVETKDLAPGYIISMSPGIYTNTTPSKFRKLNTLALRMRNDYHVIRQPEEMTSDIAWLLGYLWGDGSMSPDSFRLRWIDQRIENLEKVKRILYTEFALPATIKKATDKNAYRIDVGSKFLWHWLIINNVFKYYENRIDIIPEIVRRSTHEHVLAFFAGLIDADGCVVSRNKEIALNISTADESFAKHIQHVALSLGIVFGRSHSTKGFSWQPHRNLWMLTSVPETIPERFEMLEKHSNKMRGQEEIRNRPWSHKRTEHRKTRILGKVTSVLSIEDMSTYDVSVENEPWFYAGGIKSHNSTPKLAGKTPGISYPTFHHTLIRVRVGKNSPVVGVLQKSNVPFENDVYSPDTLVFEFPVLQGPAKTAMETTIWEQAANVMLAQREWSDNSVSVTLYFQPKWLLHKVFKKDMAVDTLRYVFNQLNYPVTQDTGIQDIIDKVHRDGSYNNTLIKLVKKGDTYEFYRYNPKNEEDQLEEVLSTLAPVTKSISLLPHTIEGVYEQSPQEGITMEEYERRVAQIKDLDWSDFIGSDGEDEKFCTGDSCRIQIRKK